MPSRVPPFGDADTARGHSALLWAGVSSHWIVPLGLELVEVCYPHLCMFFPKSTHLQLNVKNHIIKT